MKVAEPSMLLERWGLELQQETNGRVGRSPEDYEDQRRDYGYGVSNEEGSIHEFCAAKSITVGNTLSKNRASRHLVTY